jgi:hypothetical protein
MAKTTKVTATPKTPRRKSSKSPEFALASTASISEAEIARRAFEVYRARGGQHGRDLDDWLQAERELRTEPPQSAN